MNSVNLIGRLTRDPEVRYTQSQMAVARFTVAIDRGKDRDGNDRGADFPSVVVFGRQAENCEKYLGKGRLVGVSGRISTGKYTSNKTGETVWTTEVVASRIQFLEWKRRDGLQGGAAGAQQNQRTAAGVQQEYQDDVPEGFEQIDDDVPF